MSDPQIGAWAATTLTNLATLELALLKYAICRLDKRTSEYTSEEAIIGDWLITARKHEDLECFNEEAFAHLRQFWKKENVWERRVVFEVKMQYFSEGLKNLGSMLQDENITRFEGWKDPRGSMQVFVEEMIRGERRLFKEEDENKKKEIYLLESFMKGNLSLQDSWDSGETWWVDMVLKRIKDAPLEEPERTYRAKQLLSAHFIFIWSNADLFSETEINEKINECGGGRKLVKRLVGSDL